MPSSDRPVATYQGNCGRIFCVTFSPDGKRLALGTGGFDARIWDAATGRELAILEGFRSGISSVAFSPSADTLAVGSWDKTVSLWDIINANRRNTIECSGQVHAVTYSVDGSSLVIAAGREVKICDLSEGRPTERTTIRAEVCGISLTRDGRSLITAEYNGSVRTWDTTTGHSQAIIQQTAKNISYFAMSRDATVLAIADDSTVALLDYNGARTVKRAALKGVATCLTFSPDEKILAAGMSDNSIRLWDASNGRELGTLTGHAKRINSVAFSPLGKTLASASDDGSVKLWTVRGK